MYKLALFFTFITFTCATLDPFISTVFTGYTPSDGSIASSPNRIATSVNGNVSIFNKDGTKLDSKTAITFHGHSQVFDPRINWDFFDERLIVVQVSSTNPSANRIVIATSKSPDPDDLSPENWSKVHVNIFDAGHPTPHWADFPIVGLDEYNLYIKYNGFTANNGYVGPFLVTIPKSHLMFDRELKPFEYHYQKLPINVGRVAFSTLNEAKLGEPVYMIYYRSSQLQVHELVNRASGQPEVDTRLITITFRSTANTPASQKGSATLISTGSPHFNNAYYKDGYSYVVATYAQSSPLTERTLVVYKINHEENTYEEIQSISADIPNYYLYFPSLALDKYHNIGILAYSSGTDQYISASHISLNNNGSIIEPLNVAVEGKSSYTKTRYGDYSATAIDPDGVNIWSLSQLPAGSSKWNAWVTNTCPSCVTGPTECPVGYADFPDCDICDDNYYSNETLCLECPDCGQFGRCDANGECSCEAGHEGDNCEFCCVSFYGNECLPCPDCGPQGFCDSGRFGSGTCLCTQNYDGTLCDECAEGYFGPRCEPCPDCHGRGICNEETLGLCSCFEQFTSEDCSECAEGYFGPDCIKCPDCGPNGSCSEATEGLCVCNDNNWIGNLCDKCVGTPEECGYCNCGINSQCLEEVSFRPVERYTPNNGTYICICDEGWDQSTDCTTCADGYVGSNCILCQDCNGNGDCSQETGNCICDPNFAQPDCSMCVDDHYGPDCLPCPDCNTSECTEEGSCECLDNYIGEFCDECSDNHYGPNCVLCQNCGLNGRCRDGISSNGQCVCNEGWTRDSDGRCTVCDDNYFGNDCLPCPNCGPNGFCDETTNNQCVCNLGWESSLCNKCSAGYYPPNCDPCHDCLGINCSSSEGCICGDNSGQTGVNCHLCATNDENACNGHGTCNGGVCTCDEPYTNKFCEDGEELVCDFCNCHEPFGVYIDNSCRCNEGFFDSKNGCKKCLEGNESLACPFRDCNYPNGINTSPNVCECINKGYGGVNCNVELTCQ